MLRPIKTMPEKDDFSRKCKDERRLCHLHQVLQDKHTSEYTRYKTVAKVAIDTIVAIAISCKFEPNIIIN